MADYLKKFATQSEYDAYIQAGYPKPNVSYIVDNDEIIFTNYQDGPAGPDSVIVGISPEDWPSTATTVRNTTVTTMIERIYIPEGVTEIADGAFSNNFNRLAEISLPSTLTTIGNNAFNYTTQLVKFTIQDIAAWCNVDKSNSGGFPFYLKESKQTHIMLGDNEIIDLVIPSGVTEIKANSFNTCTSLTSVTIPDTVTTLGFGAFAQCKSLTSVDIPNSVTSIGNRVFDACSRLASVTIPDSVTSIGDYAFQVCPLTSVDIPASVTSIGTQAFNGCSVLTSVTVRATTPPTAGNSLFSYTPSSLVIYVPSESVEAYKAASGWSYYANQIQAISE